MERLFFTVMALAVLVISTASCQEKDMQRQIIENLKEKYKELGRTSEYVSVNGVPVAQEIRFIQEADAVVPDYSRLRQIALVRHGEPDLPKTGKFSYEQAKDYIKHYDSVGIILPDKPFFMLKEDEEVVLYTSTIPRAQATAKYLFGENREAIASADFREFERIIGNRRIKMDLPLKYWTTSARILWMLGLDREGIESFSDARERARKAAQVLDESSQKNPKVVLVAHGFLNRFIKKSLEDKGWRVVRDGGDNYFATTILAKIAPQEDAEKDKKKDILITNQNL